MIAVIKAGSHAENQRCCIGTRYSQRAAQCPHGSAFCKAGKRSSKENPVPASGSAGIQECIFIVRTGTAVVIIIVPSV